MFFSFEEDGGTLFRNFGFRLSSEKIYPGEKEAWLSTRYHYINFSPIASQCPKEICFLRKLPVFVRTDPRYVGAPGKDRAGKFWLARAQDEDNFRSNPFACGNLNLLEPYLRLFQQGLCSPCNLVPRVAAMLAYNLVRFQTLPLFILVRAVWKWKEI